jgi:hypothetical protein
VLAPSIAPATSLAGMTTPELAAGPSDLGIRLGADAAVSSDGWLVRDLAAAPGLDGPPGILQGGLSAGVAVAIARAVDRFGAPLTSLDARLRAPTPLGRPLQARVRPADGTARHEVETRDGDTVLMSAVVELAGHDAAPQVYDLLELATVPLPAAVPQQAFPTCIVCGPEPTHPFGQRLHPHPYGDEAIVTPWVAGEELGDARGVIDPLLVSAVLDCPTVWAAMGYLRSLGHVGALLVGYRLQFFHDAPVMEPLRTVARFDGGEGRKIRARSALVDEDGVVYAVASALHLGVSQVPSFEPT